MTKEELKKIHDAIQDDVDKYYKAYIVIFKEETFATQVIDDLQDIIKYRFLSMNKDAK